MAYNDTLTSMTQDIRDHLDEASAGYWQDTEIQRKIVKRYRELWARIIAIRDDWFKSTVPYALTLTAGVLKYALPADFFRTATIITTTLGQTTVKWVWMSCKDPRFIAGQEADFTYSNPGVIYYDIEGVTSIVVSPTPQAVLAASMEYYTMPTDPAAAFGLPDPFLRYIEMAATADCMAKGPVGMVSYWAGQAESAWQQLLPILSAPRSGQNNSHALSMFD